MSNVPEKVPEDIQAEAAVLATLCSAGNELAASIECRRLTADHFVHPCHRAVFQALLVLVGERQEINPLTLKAELEIQGTLGRVGGYAGLVEILCGEEVSRPGVLVDLLTECLRRRRLIRLGAVLARQAADGTSGASLALVGAAIDELGMIARNGRRDDVSSWTEILDSVEGGEAFMEGTGLRGGWWGIPSLDDMAPIPAGQVCGVFARPGIGKTALGTQIAVESALKGRKPLMVQLELPKLTAKARIASYFTRTSTRQFKEGTYTERDIQTLRKQSGILAEGSIVSPRQGTPWDEIEATIIESIERRGTDLVIIDQFSHIGHPIAKGSSEAYAYARVSERITGFAKDHQNCGVVLLGQLKQDAACREPNDGDVADSDRPARDAAVSLMLWRDTKGGINGVLRKNRDGPMDWKKPLTFEGWAQRFSEETHETSSGVNPTDSRYS